MKRYLSETYTQTVIRGDGQVASVAFNTITVEIVPVFNATNSQFVIPDTNRGGSWVLADPLAGFRSIEYADVAARGNVRRIARMLKMWKRYCAVPIKSFILELLIVDFFNTPYAHREQDYFYYDWFVRDFFKYLCSRADGFVVEPGTNYAVGLGSDWLSRAQTASERALKACEYEYADLTISAGEEWQKVFGPSIPIHEVTGW